MYFMAILNYVAQSEMLFHIIHMVREKVTAKQYNNFDNVFEASPYCTLNLSQSYMYICIAVECNILTRFDPKLLTTNY